MTRVHVLCEGQTEVAFTLGILRLHFQRMNITLRPCLVRTGGGGRGGITSYGRVRRQLISRCKEDRKAKTTILWDLYGMPRDFPAEIKGGPEGKHKIVKQTLLEDIDQPNFIPNVIVHEFETLLFSEPAAFGRLFDKEKVVEKLIAIRNKAHSPEHINDSPTGAPSKRIMNVCDFNKPFHGVQIAKYIGLATIRKECPLFDGWITEIENLKHYNNEVG